MGVRSGQRAEVTSQANVEFLTVFACVDFTGRETKKLRAQFHSQEDQSEEFLFLKKVTLKNGKKVPHVQKCVIFGGGDSLRSSRSGIQKYFCFTFVISCNSFSLGAPLMYTEHSAHSERRCSLMTCWYVKPTSVKSS